MHSPMPFCSFSSLRIFLSKLYDTLLHYLCRSPAFLESFVGLAPSALAFSFCTLLSRRNIFAIVVALSS